MLLAWRPGWRIWPPPVWTRSRQRLTGRVLLQFQVMVIVAVAVGLVIVAAAAAVTLAVAVASCTEWLSKLMQLH